MYKILAKRKGKNERYTVVERGSGSGGGTRKFKTLKEAHSYSRSLTSFNTKVQKVRAAKKYVRASNKRRSAQQPWNPFLR